MSNDKLVCFRADEETKQRISKAAYSQGITTTSFLQRIVMKEVERIENKKYQPHGLKHWLKTSCAEAGQGGLGFRNVGNRFAKLCKDELEKELPNGAGKVRELQKLLEPALRDPASTLIENDHLNKAVWDWLTEVFPEASEWIPIRRREQFLLGVYDETWERTAGANR